jgi:hypothetical protein
MAMVMLGKQKAAEVIDVDGDNSKVEEDKEVDKFGLCQEK